MVKRCEPRAEALQQEENQKTAEELVIRDIFNVCVHVLSVKGQQSGTEMEI